MRHRPGRPGDFDAGLRQPLTGRVDIGHTNRKMTEASAERIGFGLIPVMGQLDDGIVLFIAVADEGKSELAGRVLAPADQGSCPVPPCKT